MFDIAIVEPYIVLLCTLISSVDSRLCSGVFDFIETNVVCFNYVSFSSISIQLYIVALQM